MSSRHLIVTGLTNSQTYTFKVSAVNARGTGVASPASIAVLIGAPNAPTGVTAAVLGLGRARVSWTSAVNNGSNVTSYIVTPIKNGVAEAPRVLGTSTIQNITGLTVGASYTFTVQATNARGTSPASAPSNAVTIT
jgi:hypothetical protein